MGKGEIARYEQFLLFPQCFQKACFPGASKGVIVWEWVNLLLRLGWLDHDNLSVFGKNLFQPVYRILKKAFEENLPKECILRLFNMRDETQNSQMSPLAVVQEWASTIKNKSNVKCNFFETASDVPDDLRRFTFRKTKQVSYYIHGRHSNVDCSYLSQNYAKLPRQTIRENANFICLFPQDLKNINHIHSDHVGEDMSREEFRKFCRKCWEKPRGFAVIDLTSKKDAGKYRDGFDNFFIS